MLTLSPFGEPARALPGPPGQAAAEEERAAGEGEVDDEGDGAMLVAEDDALCDGGGVAEPVATTGRAAEVGGGPAVDDVWAAWAPYVARAAALSATATVAAVFFALADATAGPSRGIPGDACSAVTGGGVSRTGRRGGAGCAAVVVGLFLEPR
ncbi:hypothetical protein [Streptomyces sp. cg2]|uniref:hypothetical protein n=1 Tax=Streptomyces sp. cg2 TaxID=3238799 RepID=UPI0034E1E69B